MEPEDDYKFSLSKGPAAAHIHLTKNNTDKCEYCQLTLDWTYDGVYFKFLNDDWVILSIGEKTKTHQLSNIDAEEKIKIFKIMASYFLNELPNYSGTSDASLIKLQELIDSFN